MRSSIFLTTLMVLGCQTAAETSITADIDLIGDIAVYHYSDRRGGLYCKGGKGTVYKDDVLTYAAPLRLATKDRASVRAMLHVEPQTSPRLEVGINASIKSEPNFTHYQINVTEASIKEGKHDWPSGCENNHWSEVTQSAGYKGVVRLRYEVPQGVWAIVIGNGVPNSVFLKSAERPMTGILMHAPGDDYEIVWVKPGTVIERSFELNADANALRPSSSYEFGIVELGRVLDAGAAKSLLTSNDLTNALQNLVGGKTLSSQLGDAQYFMERGLSLLRSRDATLVALRALPMAKLRWLSDILFTLANATLDIKRPDIEMSVKATAALLSYEVASLTVEEMAPYCEMRNVKMPILDVRVPVLGARYAQFLLEGLRAHLNPNIFAAHSKFLEQIKSASTRYSTYGQVARDHDLYRSVAQAFKVLRAGSLLYRRPFRQAHQDLTEYYQIFGGIDSAANRSGELLKKLSMLVQGEDAYRGELTVHLNQYRTDNTRIIDVSGLETRLGEMKALMIDVSEGLGRQGRFLSVDGESDVEVHTLLELLVGLRMKNFGIMASAYENVPFTFEFENVRAAYVNQERLMRNQKIINSCVSEGMTP